MTNLKYIKLVQEDQVCDGYITQRTNKASKNVKQIRKTHNDFKKVPLN